MKKQPGGTNPPHGKGSRHHHQFNSGHSHARFDAQHSMERRRDYLWRRQLELELEMRSLLAQQQALQRSWNFLQERKTALQGSKPAVVLSVLLTRHSSMPERNYHYAIQRITQEEQWLLQQGHTLEAQRIAIAEQLDVLTIEWALLDQQ